MEKLDPRTRLVLLTLSVTAVLLTKWPALLAAAAVLLTVALWVSRDSRPSIRLPGLITTPIVLVFGIGLIFYDFYTAVILTLRLFNLLAVSAIFFRALDANELGGALRKVGVPFTPAFILTTALRYVPLMTRKIRNIRDAQQARGIDLRPRFKNLPNLAALLVPLAVQSFILADDLALAMESRGFRRRGRSSRRVYRIRFGEYLLMAASAALVSLLAWWERG